MRPPWALAEPAFVETCIRCDACRTACPTHVIVEGAGGFPVVSFDGGQCIFCRACLDSCTPGALADRGGAPWVMTATIARTCLSLRGVACRTCGDTCPEKAIRFRMVPGAVAVPAVQMEACTGCGACVAPCPVDAVSVQSGVVAS